MNSQQGEIKVTITITGYISVTEIKNLINDRYIDTKVFIDDGIGNKSCDYNFSDPKHLMVSSTTPEHTRNDSIVELNDTLEWRNKEINDLKKTTAQALTSVTTFQRQHQALYDRFVSLRHLFDEQKLSLLNLLWIHCGAYHPDLREIPVIEDMAEFLEEDDRVGDFVVGETLGQGQSATVRSCYRSGSTKELAVKIMKKDRFISFPALKSISNEIEILKKLKNDYIICIYDVIQTRDNLYIVTEKGGRDLFETFELYPDGLSEIWAKDIITNVLKPILYCHDRDICHRGMYVYI